MIAFVRGEVTDVGLSSAVVEVGGVGLEVMCTPGTLATLRTGRSATLPTSMVVREDSLTLFGFLDDEEKQTFELVQTASGVGPKLAPGPVRPWPVFSTFVRTTSGEMPPFTTHNLTDQELADIYAYLAAVPASPAPASIPLLQQNLAEEKATDQALTELAESAINEYAEAA